MASRRSAAGACADAAAGSGWSNSMTDANQRSAMTKADIVDKVCEKVGGFSKKEAADLVDQVFDTMKAVLEEGEKIKISGFGNFVVREKQPRPGRNPQTGEEITIEARRVLTFKPSNVLKVALNGEDV
jgi:integration host factor subunit alpha